MVTDIGPSPHFISIKLYNIYTVFYYTHVYFRFIQCHEILIDCDIDLKDILSTFLLGLLCL